MAEQLFLNLHLAPQIYHYHIYQSLIDNMQRLEVDTRTDTSHLWNLKALPWQFLAFSF